MLPASWSTARRISGPWARQGVCLASAEVPFCLPLNKGAGNLLSALSYQNCLVSGHQVILISSMCKTRHECNSIWCLWVYCWIYRYRNTNTRIFALSDWCPLCSYLWKSCDNWDNPHPLKQLFKLWLCWQHSSSFITHRNAEEEKDKIFLL